ncbi:unnamed protein product [Acanthoscelides obtectus]|uniref:Uncharacterized protein n=1 Tax=Acanthoscelides obtectus TaxID=200917 RepID=A0A9P0KMK7_ACAOB|nr:unnamed protein product [Acanthoscelides obtectus]CAK1647693.1 hypothetical protein AOBTE_LOCUS15347 [Acanthoscelides obtectus]
MDHDNASEASGNISESHPSVSRECSKSHATVDSASTKAVAWYTDRRIRNLEMKSSQRRR